MCGTCATEGAMKLAMISHGQRKRGGMAVPPTQEELDACVCNKLPQGSSNIGVISFKGAYHGRMFGSNSTSSCSPIQKVDTPQFDWPIATSPHYKYPLEDNEEYNRAQDDASLAQARSMIEQWRTEKNCEIAAAIIEPVQSEGGDNHISGYFGNGLRKLTKELGIFMIVDEVQTGVCLTGTYWAHEQWNLESPPDFVTFAKKMYSCGFYHTAETKMATPMRHHNTYFGDPVRIHLTVAQNELIKEDKLAENATTTGAYLLDGVKDLSKKFPKMMQDPRGAGLMQAFTCESMAQRNALIKAMKTTGIHAGPLSTHVLRIRPTLYFEKKHADLYLDRLNKAAMSIQ